MLLRAVEQKGHLIVNDQLLFMIRVDPHYGVDLASLSVRSQSGKILRKTMSVFILTKLSIQKRLPDREWGGIGTTVWIDP